MADLQVDQPRVEHEPYQFSILGVLIVTTLVAIVLPWVMPFIRQATPRQLFDYCCQIMATFVVPVIWCTAELLRRHATEQNRGRLILKFQTPESRINRRISSITILLVLGISFSFGLLIGQKLGGWFSLACGAIMAPATADFFRARGEIRLYENGIIFWKWFVPWQGVRDIYLIPLHQGMRLVIESRDREHKASCLDERFQISSSDVLSVQNAIAYIKGDVRRSVC